MAVVEILGATVSRVVSCEAHSTLCAHRVALVHTKSHLFIAPPLHSRRISRYDAPMPCPSTRSVVTQSSADVHLSKLSSGPKLQYKPCSSNAHKPDVNCLRQIDAHPRYRHRYVSSWETRIYMPKCNAVCTPNGNPDFPGPNLHWEQSCKLSNSSRAALAVSHRYN